jgi:hypothetical protein
MGNALYPPGDKHATIQKLNSEAEKYKLQPHRLAASFFDNCRKNHDLEGMKFWRGVWIEIMDDDYLKSLSLDKKISGNTVTQPAT